MAETQEVRDKVVLVGLNSPVLKKEENADEDTMEELSALVETAGAETVGMMLQTFHPFVFSVEVFDNLFGQRYGCSGRCIKLMNVVNLLHCNVILRELVHNLSQIAVYSAENGHANREVTGPEKGLLAVFGQCFNVGFMVFHPSR